MVRFRGLSGATLEGVLSGEEGPDLWLMTGEVVASTTEVYLRLDAESVAVASPSRLWLFLTCGEGCASRSVSEPEPPGKEEGPGKETRELELTNGDEVEAEVVGGSGERDRIDEAFELVKGDNEDRECESPEVMDETRSKS